MLNVTIDNISKTMVVRKSQLSPQSWDRVLDYCRIGRMYNTRIRCYFDFELSSDGEQAIVTLSTR